MDSFYVWTEDQLQTSVFTETADKNFLNDKLKATLFSFLHTACKKKLLHLALMQCCKLKTKYHSINVLVWNFEMFLGREVTQQHCNPVWPSCQTPGESSIESGDKAPSKWFDNCLLGLTMTTSLRERSISCPASFWIASLWKDMWLMPSSSLIVPRMGVNWKTPWKIHTTGRENRTTRNLLQMSGLFNLNCLRSW